MARRVSQYLKVQALQTRVPRLESIRSRILALAVFGTLLPAAITLGIGYSQNRRALEDKINQDLHSQSSAAARSISVAIKERLLEMRIWAGSEQVTVNLNRFANGQGSIPSTGLREYLRSLHDKVPEYLELLVLDAQGRVLSTSGARSSAIALPSDWQTTIRRENEVVGSVTRADGGGSAVLIGVPVQSVDGRIVGVFAARISLAAVHDVLRAFGTEDAFTEEVYVVSDSGVMLATSRDSADATRALTLPGRTFRRLQRAAHAAVSYQNVDGVGVLGTLEHVPQMPWMVVAERRADVAYAQIDTFRNVALLVVLLVLLGVAWTAYRLGLVIVRPLERLTQGAAVVAMGDLDVDLPRTDHGEVGALTSVFNHMVGRLREGRQALDRTNAELLAKNAELERLSVTDGLTGLTNHRALMSRLGAEAIRSQRTDRPFAFMMADVDHFKQYNDEFGHPAGDEVLKRVAAILNEATRDVDCVARYGGEEFAILLPETDTSGALEVAERIRARVEAADIPGRHVTLSIGLAEFPKDASQPNDIISLADQALYVAKEAGRNQVVQSRRARRQKLPASPRKKATKKKS